MLMLILVGCKLYGKKESDARKSKNSLVGLWSLQFNRLMPKSPKRKPDISSFDTFSKKLFQ